MSKFNGLLGAKCVIGICCTGCVRWVGAAGGNDGTAVDVCAAGAGLSWRVAAGVNEGGTGAEEVELCITVALCKSSSLLSVSSIFEELLTAT